MEEQDKDLLLRMRCACAPGQIFEKGNRLMRNYILDKEKVLRFDAMIPMEFKDVMVLMDKMEEMLELIRQHIVRTFGRSWPKVDHHQMKTSRRL